MKLVVMEKGNVSSFSSPPFPVLIKITSSTLIKVKSMSYFRAAVYHEDGEEGAVLRIFS